MLRELAIARVCEPMSKLATIGYLKRRFDKDVALHDVYRYMDKLYRTQRDLIQQISVDHTRKILGGRIGIVFYDVTTLYFETSREDGLRAPGFSKDGKPRNRRLCSASLSAATDTRYPIVCLTVLSLREERCFPLLTTSCSGSI